MSGPGKLEMSALVTSGGCDGGPDRDECEGSQAAGSAASGGRGVVNQRQAGQRLGLSERQVRRLLRRYEAEGAVGLVSRRRGRPSNRRIAQAVKEAVLERLRSRYAGFGPTLAAEYLRQEGMRVSKETLR